jgi:acetyl-CoA carboxylase biotin carboxyl carrier protein
MDLTHDDVLKILRLIDESDFDFFQLELGDLKITLNKGGPIPTLSANPSAPSFQATAPVTPEKPTSAPTPEAADRVGEQPEVSIRDTIATDGLVPITAPLLGTFYAQPQPGAPPFVKIGSSVDEDTTVGLIEVMKVFNSITAGVSGVITDILAKNGQFVEYGQRLFLVRPSPGASSEGLSK